MHENKYPAMSQTKNNQNPFFYDKMSGQTATKQKRGPVEHNRHTTALRTLFFKIFAPEAI
jgi:hypothetical protein